MEHAFSIRLTEADFQKIKKIAEINSRSVNKQIEFLIKNTIADYEKVAGKIKIEEEKN